MFHDDYRDERRDDRDAYDRERYDARDRRAFEERRFGPDDDRRDRRWADDRDGRRPRPIGDGPAGRGAAYDFGRTDRRYSLDDTRRALPMEETDRLIASDKVEGTAVYDLTGRRVGEVTCFMVEKRAGRVAYAVVRIRGGFVSGETYRPVDWADLHYHERLDGYQIDTDRHDLRRDRSFEARR